MNRFQALARCECLLHWGKQNQKCIIQYHITMPLEVAENQAKRHILMYMKLGRKITWIQKEMERHLNKKARRSSHKNHMKGPRKHTEEDNVHFEQSLEKLIRMAMSKEVE